MALQFEPSTTFSVVGCTNTGKSFWVYTLLKSKASLFREPPKHTLYCYSIYQDLFDRMEREFENFTLHQGLPSQSTLDDFCSQDSSQKIILFDDLMISLLASKEMAKLFTEGAHHRGLSIIFISQNLYQKGAVAKTVALNIHVLVLFKSMRSTGQISHLGREIFPNSPRALVDAYLECTSEKYGYLLLDLSPHTSNDDYRMRTHIFEHQAPTIVFVPRI